MTNFFQFKGNDVKSHTFSREDPIEIFDEFCLFSLRCGQSRTWAVIFDHRDCQLHNQVLPNAAYKRDEGYWQKKNITEGYLGVSIVPEMSLVFVQYSGVWSISDNHIKPGNQSHKYPSIIMECGFRMCQGHDKLTYSAYRISF